MCATLRKSKKVPFLKMGQDDDLLFYVPFNIISTSLKSYRDDGRVIITGSVQWSAVQSMEEFASSGIRTRGSRFSLYNTGEHWCVHYLLT